MDKNVKKIKTTKNQNNTKMLIKKIKERFIVSLDQYRVRLATTISFLIIAVKKNRAGINRINTNKNISKNHKRHIELKR